MLEEMKGIGPKSLRLLEKLNIHNVNDLVMYYPFRYDVIKRSDMEMLTQDDPIIMDGVVENVPSLFHFNRKMNKMTFRMRSEEQLFQVIIYNRGFLKNKLVPGVAISVFGKYDLKRHTIVASDLRFGFLPDEVRVEPVYHVVNGITSKQLGSFIEEALHMPFDVVDYIPAPIASHYHFLEKEQSIRAMHKPQNIAMLKQARLRTKYEELFLFMLKMNYLKNKKGKERGIKRNVSYEEVEAFLERLPFHLTDDQKKCVDDIYHDLNDIHKMNRLLQGDVGSGKTIVAFISMYMNYLSGYQSALMAPTEILAIQHYESLARLVEGTNIHVGLLTGKLKAKEKKALYVGLKDGTIDMVIGTHALISEDAIYHNLGLVITDEQHRFGVSQRGNLKNKGLFPDILYMSATPIPRTYALTIYGDMDISSIKTMPSGRKPVITTVKSLKEITWVLNEMLRELKLGHQVYVIAPMIEESENSHLENVKTLTEKMQKAFGKYFQVGTLHGKMKSTEKDEVMNAFKENQIQILISTTVIEVGVDVANATMMVIFESDRFGLSSLHQLRGRVGRNDLQSYCILIARKDTERLHVLEETCDGFKISEEDFKLRGSGDLFGYRQSGDMSFQVADIKRDYSILLKAKEDSEAFLESPLYDSDEYKYVKNMIELAVQLD